MAAYQILVTVLLVVPLMISIWNYFRFARIRSDAPPIPDCAISVLVPARNEERTIVRCVESLLAQDHTPLEVIVLDDASTDRTGVILQELARNNPTLRVIQGKPLPEGWIGKNWACAQLSEEARGHLLMFTDADTFHHPSSVRATAAHMYERNLEFLSGTPHQELKTFWERAVVPMAQFLYFAYLPNNLVSESPNPRFSAANGQLLCLTRAVYTRLGGHSAVRASIVEDVELGRRAKRMGLRTGLATAVETVDCRMYTSVAEIVSGFSKNLFPGLGYSIVGVTAFIVTTLAMYVAPLGFAIHAAVTGSFDLYGFRLPMLHLFMAGTMRGLLAARFALSRDQILLHPIGSLAAAVIAINSVRRSLSSVGVAWKGRSYGKILSRR